VSPKPSSIDLDTFNGLVSSIYDAAMDSALWPEFLQRFTRSLNAPSGLLRVQDLRSKEVGIYITHGLDSEFQQQYKEYYIHIDPLMSAIAELATGTIMQTATEMPKSFRKTEFYNDYAHPQGMAHAVGCSLEKNSSRVAIIGVHRPDRAGYYEQHELALLDLLTPHLQRAFQINRYLLQLSDKANAACNTLHRLFIGAILVDGLGRPVFINSKAETMVADGCGLRISRHGLQAPKWADTLALRKLIFEASQSSQKTGGALSISRPSSSKPLSILVIPINKENGFDFGIDMSQVSAALFIGTAGQQLDFSLEVLSSLYGLTQAEARLAGALTNGHSLEKIAEQFKVSKNTIRSQLKSCFQKTGVNRQTELVKLILCDPAALAGDGDLPKSG